MVQRGFPRELAGTFSETVRQLRQNHVEASQTLTSDKDPLRTTMTMLCAEKNTSVVVSDDIIPVVPPPSTPLE